MQQITEIDFSNSQDDSPLEIQKLKKDNAHLFELPPMSSSEGHSHSDFDKLIFRGVMKMALKGEHMVIYFINEDNSVFLASLLDKNYEKFVTPAKDSSRYFTIKALNNKGEARWAGLGNLFY